MILSIPISFSKKRRTTCTYRRKSAWILEFFTKEQAELAISKLRTMENKMKQSMQSTTSEEVVDLETRTSISVSALTEPPAKKTRVEVESKGMNKFAAHIKAS